MATGVSPSIQMAERERDTWRKQFEGATKGSGKMGLLEFMQTTGCRSRFYAVKLFDKLDADGTGTISFEDYCSLMRLLATGSPQELASFAFDLFDCDGNGAISSEELRKGLQASVEESESVMEEAEISQLVDVLAKLFEDETTGGTTRGKFIEVLQSYPDILGNFTIGCGSREAALRGRLGREASLRGRSGRTLRKGTCKCRIKRMWVFENPRRAYTYGLTILVIAACFGWRFSRYAGDCSGVDLDFRDPYVNVTRRDIQQKADEIFGVKMSDTAAKYMCFSKEMQYDDPVACRDARKRDLMSWTLPIAKGCGQGMKATFTLILIPVSRTLMTALRTTFLGSVFDFDDAIAYHRLLGKIGFALAWTHSLLHVVDVLRWTDQGLYRQWAFAFPKDLKDVKFDVNAMTNTTEQTGGVPTAILRSASEQPGVCDLLKKDFAITGIILLVTFTIAAVFALDYPKKLKVFNKSPGEKECTMSCWRRTAVRFGRMLNNFNCFWYTHHLFVIFYGALLFHPKPHIPDERNEWAWSDSWLWVMLPVFLYSMERINRAFQSSAQTPVVGLRVLPGKVVELKVKKPEGWTYKAGQYIFINCWQIAVFEWHPFTLTSAPHSPYLSVHIRAAGDWTTALFKAAKSCREHCRSASNLSIDQRSYPLNVRVAGPFGAPAQNYEDYGVVVCVGAGIGVTPFASILSNVLHSIRTQDKCKLKKVYFHWSVRSRSEASWFKTLIEEIAAEDTEGILDLNIHITSLKEANDLRIMLLRLAEFEDIDQEEGRVLGKSVVRFGRPNWSHIMKKIQDQHSKESKIGVFYCGPSALKRVIKAECNRRSTITNPKFIFRKEVF